MTNNRNQYTREFKLEAISLVTEHKRKIPDVASSLGIGKSTLQKWLSQYRQETCLLYTSPSPRDVEESRMPSSA